MPYDLFKELENERFKLWLASINLLPTSKRHGAIAYDGDGNVLATSTCSPVTYICGCLSTGGGCSERRLKAILKQKGIPNKNVAYIVVVRCVFKNVRNIKASDRHILRTIKHEKMLFSPDNANEMVLQFFSRVTQTAMSKPCKQCIDALQAFPNTYLVWSIGPDKYDSCFVHEFLELYEPHTRRFYSKHYQKFYYKRLLSSLFVTMNLTLYICLILVSLFLGCIYTDILMICT